MQLGGIFEWRPMDGSDMLFIRGGCGAIQCEITPRPQLLDWNNHQHSNSSRSHSFDYQVLHKNSVEITLKPLWNCSELAIFQLALTVIGNVIIVKIRCYTYIDLLIGIVENRGEWTYAGRILRQAPVLRHIFPATPTFRHECFNS